LGDESVKIGIARGLLYYIYYPLWFTFFEKLGCEVIVSDFTNKAVLDIGTKDFADDACLPLKLYRGHIQQLMGEVDAIFIPSLVSVAKGEYICPKFCGLPEMVKNSLKELPIIIDDTLNMHKHGSNEELRSFFLKVGLHITHNKAAIAEAFNEAIKAQESYEALQHSGFLPIDLLEAQKNNSFHELKSKADKSETIGVVGHPYVIYDEYLSMNLIGKIREAGYNALTPENLEETTIDAEAGKLPKHLFYTFGKGIYGAAINMMQSPNVKGVIYMSAFGCGVDAFVTELVQRRGRRISNTPLMILNIDEHTGQAGIDTRVEAFLDMMRWRDRNEGNISTYRKHLYRG